MKDENTHKFISSATCNVLLRINTMTHAIYGLVNPCSNMFDLSLCSRDDGLLRREHATGDFQ